jgi:hypothetical protein
MRFRGETPGAGPGLRRILFARQLERLRVLDPAWEQRRAREIDRVLHEHPFDNSIEA